MGETPRGIAFAVLQQVLINQAYTNLALQQALRDSRLDGRDRALATEIVYGTVQRQITVDALMSPYIKRPIRDLDGASLTILRMTVYQLAFLDKIPHYAALNEAVELAKRAVPRAAGFVNGVLRAYLRNPQTTEERIASLERKAKRFADRASLRYGYPVWIVERFEHVYGRDRTLRILSAGNEPSALSVRVNRLRASRQEVARELAEAIPESDVHESPLSPVGLRLRSGTDVDRLAAFQGGRITVQDEGAMLIAPLLTPSRGERILDMCAAPGTKTTHIAELQGDAGSILACDIHVHKLKLIRQARDRLGLTSIETRLSDARMLSEAVELAGTFDAVLLDAPCSGLGVLRHRPDIRFRRRPRDLAKLADLQRELLVTAVGLVRPGGRIVYSTCTIVPEENETLVANVIEQLGGAIAWDDIRGQLPESLRDLAADGHGLTLTPELYDTDGFYMARLVKR